MHGAGRISVDFCVGGHVVAITYEFWQDRETTDVWAVKLRDERVIGAAQIARPDVTSELLPYLAYREDDVAELQERRDQFRRIDGRKVA